MKLIDRYVTEVGKRLPLVKGRKDIENELRSTLEDMLEDRAAKAGRPSDEAMEMELLKEYGAPAAVAQTYNPYPYLIGPRVYPMFLMVLKIVIAAITLGLTIATVIQIINQTPQTSLEVFKAIGGGALNLISASVAAFGNIALIFALIERYAPASEFKMNEDEKWEPASLIKEPEPDDVKAWELIFGIVFIFIFISIFNFNADIVGIYSFNSEGWTFIPILTDAFFRALPLMNIGWIAEIILNGILLRTGRWQTSTRLFSIAIKVFQIFILAMLLSGPAILAITPETLSKAGIDDAEAIRVLGIMASQGIRIILGLAIFGSVADIIKTGVKIIQKPL